MNEQQIADSTVLEVISSDHLQELEAIIHDEYFELDKVNFQSERGILDIPYRRIFHGGPSRIIKNWIIAKVVEVDAVRAILIIHHVTEYSSQDSAHIGTYSFNSISYDGYVLKIICNESLELKMVVSRLLIQSRYLETRGKARITLGLFWDSSAGNFEE